MIFKNVSLIDIPRLLEYFKKQNSRMSDFTVGSFFEWAEYLETQFAVVDEALIIRFFDRQHGHYIYAYPISFNKITNEEDEIAFLVRCVKWIEEEIDNRHALTLAAVPEDKLTLLEKTFKVQYHYERMWSDYLYDAAAFREFSGKKYHSKRNHISRFLRDYGEYNFEFINDDNLSDALELFSEYQKNGQSSELSDYEFNKSQEVLNNLDQLQLIGGMISVEGKVVGVTVGSVIFDTLYVHIEKALRDYNGAYTVLANAFARQFPLVSFINREDDAGDEGLRKSKLSYNPIKLIHKYVVYINGVQNIGEHSTNK